MQKLHILAAIVGAQLIGIGTQPKPVQSFDCNQPLQQLGTGISNFRAKLSSDRETLLNEFRRRHPNTPLGHFSEQPSAAVVPSPVVPAARTQVSTPAGGISAFGMNQSQIDSENTWDKENLPHYQPQAPRCEISPVDHKTYCGKG